MGNGNIESMKTELKENSGKIDNINHKINAIEFKTSKNEKANKAQFEEIKSKVDRIETTVTDKVIEIIDPQFKTIKKDLKNELAEEMKTLMEKELNRRFPEKPPEEEKEKTKKNDEEDETPTGSDSENEHPEREVEVAPEA